MKKIYTILTLAILAIVVVAGCTQVPPTVIQPPTIVIGENGSIISVVTEKNIDLKRFNSLDEIEDAFEDAFEDARKNNRPGFFDRIMRSGSNMAMMETGSASQSDTAADFSATNVQVEGVDEADIVKTDGKYIYTLSNNKIYVVEAYPAYNAELISSINFNNNFYANEMFIDEDRLLVFGNTNYNGEPEVRVNGNIIESMPYIPKRSLVQARLYDISDKENIELVKTVDVEGGYISSRKIGEYVYFVVSSYPYDDNIIPLIREDQNDFEKIAEPTEIGYLEPIVAQSLMTIVAMPMDEDKDIAKETIVGSADNIYASLENMYIAQSRYGWYGSGKEETYIYKIHLDKDKIDYVGSGKVPGSILNQFSMDEYDEHFRIATTKGNMWQGESENNLYVLDEDMDVVGELEGLAPGERIYSVRFMGKKGYVVTFKKVDPLFVIDLSDPEDPNVLGKLKIPGYSDYLHPIDENHIIGIGKDTVEADEDLVNNRGMEFAWYQGIKMAVFDVSDVEHPIELHKEIIGDRGTDSEALHNHKAFLFDKERELLVLPIKLAEIQGEPEYDNQQGKYTFQGAYVYNLNIEDGFDLRGRISHIDNQDVYENSGYYLGDYNSHVRRALYIGDVLYTISNNFIKMNDLLDLDELNVVELESGDTYHVEYY